MPHILITNDDGIHAPGLRALVDALREEATLTVVAPSRERSAAAQSLTLRQPIYMDQLAPNEYSIEGTPADANISGCTSSSASKTLTRKLILRQFVTAPYPSRPLNSITPMAPRLSISRTGRSCWNPSSNLERVRGKVARSTQSQVASEVFYDASALVPGDAALVW